MAIKLIDEEVYRIYDTEQDRRKLLNFFLDGHAEDIVVVYNKNENFIGHITYKAFCIANYNLQEAIYTDYIILNETIWEQASKKLLEVSYLKAIPVFTENKELVYFARHDDKLWGKLRKLDLIINAFHKDMHVHIKGINEVLYKLKKLLVKRGVYVTVEGKAWTYLGETETCINESEAIIICEDCDYIDRLYYTMSCDRDEWKRLNILAKESDLPIILHTAATHKELKLYETLLENKICPEAVCGIGHLNVRTLFGKLVHTKSEILANYPKAIHIFLIWNWKIEVECEIENFIRNDGVQKDNIFVVTQKSFYVLDQALKNVMQSVQKVMILGNKKNYELLRNYFEDDLIVFRYINHFEQNFMPDNSTMWFYVGNIMDKNTQKEFEKYFAICMQQGIYLSDYFLHNFKYLENKYEDNEYNDQIIYLQRQFEQPSLKCGGILFYLSKYSYFWDSIAPVFYECQKRGLICTILFPDIEYIVQAGKINFERIIRIIKRLRKSGIRCVQYSDWNMYESEYRVCFLCSEYSGVVGPELRRSCKRIVALQTTGFYSHVYGSTIKIEDLFAKKMENIDYLVVSEFIADWIIKKDASFRKKEGVKLLRFGYPKMDTIYDELMNDQEIPAEWQERIGDKKVFLCTTDEIKRWLPFFENEDDKIIIWRPHPNTLNYMDDEMFSGLRDMKNIIVDEMESYYVSFACSDALISTALSSVNVNYLFTGKPILLLYGACDQKNCSYGINFEEEEWFKASYIARSKYDVQKYIQMIGDGKDVLKEEHEKYRQYMIKDFDGQVSSRICNFLFR